MGGISNDKRFRDALDGLDVVQQRSVGALFVDKVKHLSDDPRVANVLDAARDPGIDTEALNAARRAAKTAALEAHTRCGSDGEWTDQAGYFVARATEACLEPEGRAQAEGPAWKAAMTARMARTCLAAESDEDAHDSENQTQYNILNSYLDA